MEMRPIPLLMVRSLSSLDYAVPTLTAEERAFVLSEGYICTVGPTRFLYKGEQIDELAFMQAVGMLSYASSLANYRSWNTAWISATCLSAISLVAEFLTLDQSQRTAAGLETGTALALSVSIGGGSLNYLRKPERPYFESLAYKVNETNRKLILAPQASPQAQ